MEGWLDNSYHPGDVEDEDASLGRDLKMVKALSKSLEYNNTLRNDHDKNNSRGPVNTKAYLEEVSLNKPVS